MSENKILYGLEQVYVAFEDTTPGTYKAPQEIPGAVAFTTNTASERVAFSADDVPYFTMEVNNGYTGTLEMALVPDEILAEMLGWAIDDTNGMVVEVANATPKKFALMGQVQGDSRNRRFIYYNVMALRPDQDSETKGETIAPKTQSLPVVIQPITHNDVSIVKGTLEKNGANDGIYDNFFNAVLMPGGSGVAVSKTSLQAAIALGDTLTAASYQDPSKTTFSSALSTAKTVEGGTPTQKQVNDADKALRAAILGLVPTA